MNRVIIASLNKDKIKEIESILSKFNMHAISRDEAGVSSFEIDETGDTYEENSLLKANIIKEITGLPTIADDSGLSVDVLDGAPGIYSARYAGESCTYRDNNRKLLAALEGYPPEQRKAVFTCVISMVFPNGDKIVAKGDCHGRIAEELRGKNGFGYDPLFIPDGCDKTFAEMTPEEKNSISHRAKALEKLEELIRERFSRRD